MPKTKKPETKKAEKAETKKPETKKAETKKPKSKMTFEEKIQARDELSAQGVEDLMAAIEKVLEIDDEAFALVKKAITPKVKALVNKAAPKIQVPKPENKPTGVPSAFILFSKDHRSEVQVKNKNMKGPQITSELGRMWREDVTKAEKTKYDAKVKKLKAKYEEDMKAWQENFPDEAALESDRVKSKSSKTKAKPTRPPTAYHLFLKAYSEENLTREQKTKKWNDMKDRSTEEYQKFKLDAADIKQTWKSESEPEPESDSDASKASKTSKTDKEKENKKLMKKLKKKIIKSYDYEKSIVEEAVEEYFAEFFTPAYEKSEETEEDHEQIIVCSIEAKLYKAKYKAAEAATKKVMKKLKKILETEEHENECVEEAINVYMARFCEDHIDYTEEKHEQELRLLIKEIEDEQENTNEGEQENTDASDEENSDEENSNEEDW